MRSRDVLRLVLAVGFFLMGSVSAYAQFSVKNDTDYPVYFFSDSEPGQAETIPVQESREWSGARQHLLACYRVDSEKFYCSAPALDNPDDRNLVVVGRCDERCLHQRLGPKVCYCGTHWTISLFW